MRYRVLAHRAILTKCISALREAMARRWQSMVRQTQAYDALAAIDVEIADHWGTAPGLTREQRIQAMEKAARALVTGSAKEEAAGRSHAQLLGT
jgi:hypothetical protein